MTMVGVDARMLRSSGIGTILVNILPRLIERRPEWHWRVLIAEEAHIADFAWLHSPTVATRIFNKPLYSIGEQVFWPASFMNECDLLWSPNYNIPLRWRGRLLVNVNDVAHLALREMYGGAAKQLYAKTMFGKVRNRADSIVFISQFSAKEFGAYVGEPNGTSSIVYCGVSDIWFRASARLREIEQRYILFVGNVKPHKNLPRLLDAFALAADRIPHNLIIVGRKEGFITGDNAVLKLAERIPGRIEFTGYVPDDRLIGLFAHADAVVLPSWYEGFGLPPIEAMAAGVPTLVSNAASLKEVCQDAALYCEPHDSWDMAEKLCEIASDESLRTKLRENGLRRARELSWETSADGYLKAIERLL